MMVQRRTLLKQRQMGGLGEISKGISNQVIGPPWVGLELNHLKLKLMYIIESSNNYKL